GLEGEVDPDVSLDRVTLDVNPEYRYGAGLTPSEIKGRFATDSVADLISYAVGCMFGRYSLDEPGLILADQSSTLQAYLAKIPDPAFIPDAANVIPILHADSFDNHIVSRFRPSIRVGFREEPFE